MKSSSENKGHKDDCCFSCCEKKTLVQDKMCCDFSVFAVSAQTANVIYVSDVSACNKSISSGTIKNCSETGGLTVQFVRGSTVVREVAIPVGGCVTFSIARFDTIRAFKTGSADTNTAITGEICITSRHKV